MNTLPSVIYYDRPLPVGMRIGQLTVVGWKFREDYCDVLVHIIHILQCDCGRIVELSWYGLECVRGLCLISNCMSRSSMHICGQKGCASHGDSNTKLYRRWVSMKRRCSDPKHRAYHRYGGRGIRVCEEWRNDYHAFKVWSVQHGFRDGLEIDRINNDGNYEPSNCRYVTKQENLKNKSHHNTRRKYA